MFINIFQADGTPAAQVRFEGGETKIDARDDILRARLENGVLTTVGIETRVFRPQEGETFLRAVNAHFNNPPTYYTSGIQE